MAGRPKNGGRTATFSLLSPPLSQSLAQPPYMLDKVQEQWPHGLAARPPLGSPTKGLPRGASSIIPQAQKQPQIS
jgi:hypothetical protein